MPAFTQAQLRQLSDALDDRYRTLIAQAREELARTGEGDQIEPLGRVLDGGDGAVTDLLAALDAAGADRHMHEVRAIIDAGNRLRHGMYGSCRDCEDIIDFDRLRAIPTAERCLDCQERYDREFGGTERPTL